MLKYFPIFVLSSLLTGCVARILEEPPASSHPANAKGRPGQTAPAHSVLQQDAQDSPKTVELSVADVYTCLMHPDVIRTEPGTCPKCGMRLVKKKQP